METVILIKLTNFAVIFFTINFVISTWGAINTGLYLQSTDYSFEDKNLRRVSKAYAHIVKFKQFMYCIVSILFLLALHTAASAGVLVFNTRVVTMTLSVVAFLAFCMFIVYSIMLFIKK